MVIGESSQTDASWAAGTCRGTAVTSAAEDVEYVEYVADVIADGTATVLAWLASLR